MNTWTIALCVAVLASGAGAGAGYWLGTREAQRKLRALQRHVDLVEQHRESRRGQIAQMIRQAQGGAA